MKEERNVRENDWIVEVKECIDNVAKTVGDLTERDKSLEHKNDLVLRQSKWQRIRKERLKEEEAQNINVETIKLFSKPQSGTSSSKSVIREDRTPSPLELLHKIISLTITLQRADYYYLLTIYYSAPPPKKTQFYWATICLVF